MSRYEGMSIDAVGESVCLYPEYRDAMEDIFNNEYVEQGWNEIYTTDVPDWSQNNFDHHGFGKYMVETYGIETLTYHFKTTRFFPMRMHGVVDESLYLMFKLKHG